MQIVGDRYFPLFFYSYDLAYRLNSRTRVRSRKISRKYLSPNKIHHRCLAPVVYRDPTSSLSPADQPPGDLPGRPRAEKRRPVAHGRLDVRHESTVGVELLVERDGLSELVGRDELGAV